MKKYILITAILLLAFKMKAQKYDRYDNYDFSDGLSSNYVDCIFEDSRGFMWMGTWDGLNRFDGYTFTQYKSDYTDSTNRLTGNWVFNITEDKQHNLWICTSNGLSRYNYSQNNFEIIKQFYGFAVKCVVQTEDNLLWISTVKGLFQYDYQHKKVIQQFSQFDKKNNLVADELSDLIVDKKQNLWIATISNGLIFFNTKSKQQINYHLKTNQTSLRSNKIRTMIFDTYNQLWIGTFDNGIAIFDTTAKTITYKQHNKNDANSIGSNGVSRLLSDSKGNIWACCQNGYLNRYNRQKDNFTHYQYNPYTSTSLKTKSVSCIYEDRVGNYWIGTHGNGVSCLNHFKNQIKSYVVMPNLPNSLPDNKISSFAEMNDGNLVIGTDGGGFCVFDRHNETFETYNFTKGLMSDAVTNIAHGKDNQLWISTWNGGISEFDYKTKKIHTYSHDNKNKHSLIFNNIKDVTVKNDTVWIATHGEGIALYDIKRKVFISYLDSIQTPFDLKAPTWANSIYKDSRNRYWISTAIYLYRFDGKKLTSYSMEVGNIKTISGNQIFSVFEDSYHNIWIITNSGIDKYNESTDSFERYSTTNQFPKNAKAIIEDNSHNLWISTGAELVCFNPKTNGFKTFTQEDGLPKNDFMQSSAYKLKDGTLLFGGTNGFVLFHPDSLVPSIHKPKIELVNLYIDYRLQEPSHKAGILKKAMQNTDTLTLNYSNAVISIDIAGLDFTNPNSIRYKYRIQGLNHNWINIDKERKITVPTLGPGSYILQIAAYKSKNIFSDNKKLVIIVLPMWWQTWWFRILVLLCCIGLLVILFNYRLKRIKKRNKQLEQIVSDRTAQLVSANVELKELNNTKNKLFSIIAHDLKNPINVLMGFSNMINENYDTLSDSKKRLYIGRISDSSNTIYHQLEQLLSWAMAQSNSLSHHPQNTDIAIIMLEAINLVAEMALKKEITIHTSCELSRMAYVDAGMISTVIRNLTTNALKFTPQGGEITISAQEIDGMIVLSVSDTGVGMSEEQCGKLFKVNENKPTFGTNNEKGTGLGLVICKEFVEKNGGTISVKSQIGQGSCFMCTLPLGSEFIVKQTEEIQIENKPIAIDEEKSLDTSEKPLLLVVEDTTNIAQYIKDSLQNNYVIEIAANGRIGLEKCRELLPDLIISDVSMPEMDGEELCLAIKSDPLTNHIPLILLSARNLPQQQLDGLKKGADDYMFKPFDASILQEKIRTILKNRDLYREHIKRQMICEPDAQMPASQDDKFLEAVVRIIEANLAESQLSVEFLAKEMGISRAQLFRKFKAILGQAPVEFIRNIRLRRAAQMLKTGNWRVSDVAYSVGFSDPQYFSNCFQKEYGVLPSVYAKGKE